MPNETNIVQLLMSSPAKPEIPSPAAPLRDEGHEQFDRVLETQVADRRQDTPPPARKPSLEEQKGTVNRTQESRGSTGPRPVSSNSPQQAPRPIEGETHRLHSETQAAVRNEPLTGNQNGTSQTQHTGLPVQEKIPLATQAVIDLANSLNTGKINTAALDTFRDRLTALNIDPEIIDRISEILQNGDPAGLQGILQALRGLLQAVQNATPDLNHVPASATQSVSHPEQRALQLLVQAGFTDEEAQQIVQQVQNGNTPAKPAADALANLSKPAVEGLAAKPLGETSTGSGNLQQSGSDSSQTGAHGTSNNNPRELAGLNGDRLDTLSTLLSPDKAANTGTHPVTGKPMNPLLANAPVTQAPSAGLTEGLPGQVPAALANTAAKAVDFAQPAITETYTGRASMDKPITAQIIEKFTMRGFANQREVHIKLDPPSLGTVRMNVSTSGETVRATIVAENNIVKSIIESNLSQLKDSITHQGVKVDSFNVLVGGNASHSAHSHKEGLDYLGQLGLNGLPETGPAEETLVFQRSVFLSDNQSISVFA